MWLLSMTAFAAPPAAWTQQLGQLWVLTEGWTSMQMELRPAAPHLPEDDWIGLVFQPDGTVTWRPLQAVDYSQGCSNSFAGFRGTWTVQSGKVSVKLVEMTFSEEYPREMVVELIEPTRLILAPRGT
jgi:hypothetical protein